MAEKVLDVEANVASVGRTYKNKNDGTLVIPFAIVGAGGEVAFSALGSSSEERMSPGDFLAAYEVQEPEKGPKAPQPAFREPGGAAPTFDGRVVPTSPESPFHPDAKK